jgi:hypothetical protein
MSGTGTGPPPPAPISFVVEVTAISGSPLSANVIGISDGAGGINKDNTKLTNAYDTVANFPPIASGSSRGGKSRKGKKSKGGKSRKAKKSLRRK